MEGAIKGAGVWGIYLPKKYALATIGSRLELRMEFPEQYFSKWKKHEEAQVSGNEDITMFFFELYSC